MWGMKPCKIADKWNIRLFYIEDSFSTRKKKMKGLQNITDIKYEARS